MNWLSGNWIWILLLAFFAFHFFGHRGHRHGFAQGHNGDDRIDGQQSLPAGPAQGATPSSEPGNMHDHADPGVAGSNPAAQRSEDRQQHRHHGC